MADARVSEWGVPGCNATTLATARALFDAWLKYSDATAPKDSGADRQDNTYFAAMVYLVERGLFHTQQASSGQETGTNASSDNGSSGSVAIRDIIAGTDATVFQFFKAMTKVLELAAREQWLTQRVPDVAAFAEEFKQVEVKFMFSYMLHEKLKKTYTDICRDAPGHSQMQPELHVALQRLIWTLFVAVRAEERRTDPRATDLIPGFFLLIASVYAVLQSRGRAFTAALVLPQPSEAPAQGRQDRALLEQLCEAYCGGPAQHKCATALEKVHRFLDRLRAEGQLPAALAEADGRGLARDESSLHSSLEALTACVAARQHEHTLSGNAVEVDGLIFLEAPELVGSPYDRLSPKQRAVSAPVTPSRSSKCAPSPQRTGAAYGAGAPPRTPDRSREARSALLSQGAPTPMHGVMRDVNWLAQYVRDESTQPDDILRGYFAACDTDVTESVMTRLERLPAELVGGLEEELVATAIKLYLKSLRFILQREEERLKRTNFTKILHDDSMHRAFLAISFSIVVHTHLRHKLPFPAIPAALKVCAFEFFLMTENFLRYFEAVLPAELRRILVANRDKILDSFVWKRDSALLAHVRDRDLCAHFVRSLDACVKAGANVSSNLAAPTQASPMPVRSFRPPAYPPASPAALPRAPPSAAANPVAASAVAPTCAGSPAFAGGLAASLMESNRGAGLTTDRGDRKQAPPSNPATGSASGAPSAAGRAGVAAAANAPHQHAEASPPTDTGRSGSNSGGSPEHKDLKMSSAPTPDKTGASQLQGHAAAKGHIQKQLASLARGVWQRASSVVSELCRALNVRDKTQQRALHVVCRILCHPPARELLVERHLHQVLMCVIFAVCKVENENVLFRRIISEHLNLFAHLQLGEQIYWLIEVGSAPNQTGNLIEFYNKNFIPLCKELVLDDTSAPSPGQQNAHPVQSSATGGAHGLPPRSPVRPLTQRTQPSAARPPSMPSPSRPVRETAGLVERMMMAPPSPTRTGAAPPRTPEKTPFAMRTGGGLALAKTPRGTAMTPRTERLYTFESSAQGAAAVAAAAIAAADGEAAVGKGGDSRKRLREMDTSGDAEAEGRQDMSAMALMRSLKRGCLSPPFASL